LSINIQLRASISCYVSLIIQDKKMDYFYTLHLKEAFITKSCISLLRSWTHFSCDHTITNTYFLVSKHTKNSISIWEEAVNNKTQSSSLQLLCTIITTFCQKIS